MFKSKKYSGEFALLLVTLLWGGTFVIVKESLNDISPVLFVAIRFSFAALIMTPFIYKNLKLNWRKGFAGGLFLGFLVFAAYAFQTNGLKYTTATKSGFITGTLVVMVPILQIIIEKRKPSKGSIIGTILVFIGILFLSSGGESIFTFLNELGTQFNKGDLFTLACAFIFALQVVYLDILSHKYNFWILAYYQITVTAILSLITSLLMNSTGFEFLRIDVTSNLTMGILYTSICATLVTFILQTKYQKEVSPTKAAIIYSFEPIFAALFAFFVISEKISNFGMIGGILIFAGLLVSELYDK